MPKTWRAMHTEWGDLGPPGHQTMKYLKNYHVTRPVPNLGCALVIIMDIRLSLAANLTPELCSSSSAL